MFYPPTILRRISTKILKQKQKSSSSFNDNEESACFVELLLLRTTTGGPHSTHILKTGYRYVYGASLLEFNMGGGGDGEREK